MLKKAPGNKMRFAVLLSMFLAYAALHLGFLFFILHFAF